MSEQSAEQISGEYGSLSSAPAVPDSSEPSVQPVVAAPDMVPGQDAAMADASESETAKAEAPRVDTPKVEVPEVEIPQADAPKAEPPRFAGKVLIMSAGERNWDDDGAGPEMAPEPDQGIFGKRRLAVAAMLALAVVAGGLGGAMATAGLSHLFGDDVAGTDSHALEASIARIDSDILTLKAGVEHASRLAASQYTKTSDRLDKVERAQAEPAAKLAKLSETVDKLRAAPPAAAVPVAAAPAAAKEVTGSVTPVAPAAAPKPEVGRLPTVEGWVLRDVGNGGALIEGRRGMYEVYAGDPIPGLGRVDAIRRQDGRWVVVTSKGLIVAR
ncbi:hypothetical protein [Bradyrhizobium erythrophlei]|uniref:Uncharacterized protein n=1 Tax=Bradyrhizobium erythrophlei TaxID=1437360 RepID=A0A1M5HCB8_9BRAD|nr:hypothetical protein [Bradyrhizobium erythrophlei]SHG13551.1 hypothetical protein SAMN05444169_0730 [Bradyrhizobium erythrophlei]